MSQSSWMARLAAHSARSRGHWNWSRRPWRSRVPDCRLQAPGRDLRQPVGEVLLLAVYQAYAEPHPE